MTLVLNTDIEDGVGRLAHGQKWSPIDVQRVGGQGAWPFRAG